MLTLGDVSLLTEILQLRSIDRDPIHYNNRIATLLEALPSRLKAEGFLKRIINPSEVPDSKLLDPLDQRGPLCPLHHKLNISIIQKVFVLLALEVGHHLNHLAQKRDLLSQEQKQLISRLRALHAIWYEPDDYERFFQSRAQSTKWPYQGNKCAACSLSRIAGDAEAILDLICAISSRCSSDEKCQKPRLHRWLMAWLAHHRDGCHGDDRKNFQTRIFQNEVQTLELKTKRKELSKARKEARAPMQSIPEEVPLVDRNVHEYEHIDDDDLESVDFHGALLSTPHLSDMSRFQHDEGRKTRYADRNSVRPSYVSCSSSTHRKDKSTASLKSPVSPMTSPAEQEYVPPRASWQSVDEVPTTRRQPTHRSSEDAARSYANILPRSNPFGTHMAGNKYQAPVIESNYSTPTHQPSSSSRPSPEPESVWTDADPQASRRSSITSLMDKYANYGGLPVPPSQASGRSSTASLMDKCANYGGLPIPPDFDAPHSSEDQKTDRRGDVSASHAHRRSINAENAQALKDKVRKHLAAEDLVKRARSTRSESSQKNHAQPVQGPSPLKVDRPVPKDSKVSAENLVKRAASTSHQSKGAYHRHDHHPSNKDAGAKQPTTSRTASVESCNTLASSSLLGNRGRRERESDQTRQRSGRESRERESARPTASDALETNMTRWSMNWKDEVMNRPENKFYKDREEARLARMGTKERKR